MNHDLYKYQIIEYKKDENENILWSGNDKKVIYRMYFKLKSISKYKILLVENSLYNNENYSSTDLFVHFYVGIIILFLTFLFYFLINFE